MKPYLLLTVEMAKKIMDSEQRQWHAEAWLLLRQVSWETGEIFKGDWICGLFVRGKVTSPIKPSPGMMIFVVETNRSAKLYTGEPLNHPDPLVDQARRAALLAEMEKSILTPENLERSPQPPRVRLDLPLFRIGSSRKH